LFSSPEYLSRIFLTSEIFSDLIVQDLAKVMIELLRICGTGIYLIIILVLLYNGINEAENFNANFNI